MLGMCLARLSSIVVGMMAVTRGGMSMMRSGIVVIIFIVFGGFAVVVCRLFVMFSCVVVMLTGWMFMRHGVLPGKVRASLAPVEETPGSQNIRVNRAGLRKIHAPLWAAITQISSRQPLRTLKGSRQIF